MTRNLVATATSHPVFEHHCLESRNRYFLRNADIYEATSTLHTTHYTLHKYVNSRSIWTRYFDVLFIHIKKEYIIQFDQQEAKKAQKDSRGIILFFCNLETWLGRLLKTRSGYFTHLKETRYLFYSGGWVDPRTSLDGYGKCHPQRGSNVVWTRNNPDLITLVNHKLCNVEIGKLSRDNLIYVLAYFRVITSFFEVTDENTRRS